MILPTMQAIEASENVCSYNGDIADPKDNDMNDERPFPEMLLLLLTRNKLLECKQD